MADFDLATGTAVDRLAGSEKLPVLASAAARSATVRNITNRWAYAASGSDQANSALYQPAAAFAVGDVVTTAFFDATNVPDSGVRMRCITVRGSAYTGSPGAFTNGGASGPVLEGLWHRFAIELTPAGELPLRQTGVPCVETRTGWHSRFNEVVAFCKNQNVALTGYGVLSCTETVHLDRVPGDLSRLRFQGGVHAQNGATVGPPTFFTAAQENAAVTITPGTPVTVTLAGHGFAADKEVMLGTTKRLPGGLLTLTRYFVRNPTADTFELATSAGGASISSATAGSGTHWCFYSPSQSALPSQSGITTQDIMLWNGKVKRLGIVVRAGTNGSNKDFIAARIVVWGDGNSDWTTPPSCIGIRHEADDSPNGSYEYVANYCYMSVGIQGPSEKHSLTVRGIYGGFGVYMLPNSSADTLRVKLHLANFCCYYGEHHSTDTSPAIDFDCEGHDDPASRTNWDGGADHPAILIRNGKATSLSGEVRALNGLNAMWIDGLTNSTGASNRYGCDYVQFNNLRFVHGYGRFVVKAARQVSGQVHIKNWNNPNGVNAQNAACWYMGRVNNAAALFVTIVSCDCNEGVHVGGSVVDGYYSYGAHLGNYAVSMSGSVLSFNPDSADGTPGTERTGASGFPTAKLAAAIEKMKGGVINFTEAKGNITIGADVTDTATIVVPREARRYTITKNGAAVCDVGYATLATAGLTIN